MPSKLFLILAVPALAAGSVAVAGSDDNNAAGLAKALAGLTPGKPVMCLTDFRGDTQVRAYGDDLLYTVSNSRKYVSHTAGGCSGAGRDDIMVTQQYSGRPCSGDLARTIDRTSRFPTGSCALGDFVEYRK